MTPQLLQSMKILQMDSQELLEYIERSIEENPVLEREDAYDIRGDYEKLRQQASWIDGGFYGSSFTREDTVMAAQSAMTEIWRACPRFFATSWTGSGCPSLCLLWLNILQSR